MTYLAALTAAARTDLEGAGFKDDKIPGILDALKPVLDRAADDFAERNRVARLLADIGDDIDTHVKTSVVAALRERARQIEEGEVDL